MVLSAIQQNQHWKAYVGNVTGSLTLDDAANYTIYDWNLATITGNVFASRFNNVSWTNITCAPISLINTESAFNNMTLADSDRINATFNYTAHAQFDVATNTLLANSCNSTVTYINDTRQVPNATQPFQEILVRDTNNQFVYLTGIENNAQGFDNQPYDFQMIVAESDVKATSTTYYFYVELR
jgi:Na+-transporting NADH:ubiquinone oxidoreductase subunit NqrB